MSRAIPTLRYERAVWRSGAGLLAAIDEVGRGSLAGPVSVGVVLLAADTKPAPFGVADSKLLTPLAREKLVPRIRRWAMDCAVGHASSVEIDQIGLMAALRLAAERAVSKLSKAPDWILLDGNHDYLSVASALPLFDIVADLEPERWRCRIPVHTLIKGDEKCASVAAASVLAKTERDAMLVELAVNHPHYGFEINKAYSTPHHLAALAEHGPSPVHRCSWNLPGVLRPGAASDSETEDFAEAVAAEGRQEASGSLHSFGPETDVRMGNDEEMIAAGSPQ